MTWLILYWLKNVGSFAAAALPINTFRKHLGKVRLHPPALCSGNHSKIRFSVVIQAKPHNLENTVATMLCLGSMEDPRRWPPAERSIITTSISKLINKERIIESPRYIYCCLSTKRMIRELNYFFVGHYIFATIDIIYWGLEINKKNTNDASIVILSQKSKTLKPLVVSEIPSSTILFYNYDGYTLLLFDIASHCLNKIISIHIIPI